MIRILDKLVFWTFARLFLLVLIAAQPLFIIGDVAEELDDFIDRGVAMGDVIISYMYMMPLFIQWTFPIAALLATVFTVHNMTAHREVVAAKADFEKEEALLLVACSSPASPSRSPRSCRGRIASRLRSSARRRRAARGVRTSCTAPTRASRGRSIGSRPLTAG